MPLVALAAGIGLGVIRLDEMVVLEDTSVVPEGVGVVPDGDVSDELEPDGKDEPPLISVVDSWEPVLLGVGSPEDPVLVLNVEGVPELRLLGVAVKEVGVIEVGKEMLVPVLVGFTGVLVLTEGVDRLEESMLEVETVGDDIVGKKVAVLLRLEELDPGPGGLGESELGKVEPGEDTEAVEDPMAEVDCVDSDVVGTGMLPPEVWVEVGVSPDEIVPEEMVDVTPVEGASDPDVPGKLVVLLLIAVGVDWLSVWDVTSVDEDWPVVFETEVLMVLEVDSDGELLTGVAVDEVLGLSLSDPVDVELADETEDPDEVPDGLWLGSVLVIEPTGEDDRA